jgi:ABC-type dipeptide/oligopeptide/nickel transport system ATPase component
LLHLPAGCTFHPRCPLFEPGLCDRVRPELAPVGGEHEVACHVVAREHGTSAVPAGTGVAGAA